MLVEEFYYPAAHRLGRHYFRERRQIKPQSFVLNFQMISAAGAAILLLDSKKLQNNERLEGS
jgi:hypothetical protein